MMKRGILAARSRARRGRQKPEGQVTLWEDAVKPLGTAGGQRLAWAPTKKKTGESEEGLLEKGLESA